MNELFSKNNPFIQPIVATKPICVCEAVTAVTFSKSHKVPLKRDKQEQKRKSFKYALLLQ